VCNNIDDIITIDEVLEFQISNEVILDKNVIDFDEMTLSPLFYKFAETLRAFKNTFINF
jgi:hypothetical protein